MIASTSHNPALHPSFRNPKPPITSRESKGVIAKRVEKNSRSMLSQKSLVRNPYTPGAGTSVIGRESRPPPPSTRRRSLDPPPPSTRNDSPAPDPSARRRSPPSLSVPGPIPPYTPSKKRASSSGSSEAQSREKSVSAGVDGRGQKAMLLPLELTGAEKEEGQDKGVLEKVGSSIAKV